MGCTKFAAIRKFLSLSLEPSSSLKRLLKHSGFLALYPRSPIKITNKKITKMGSEIELTRYWRTRKNSFTQREKSSRGTFGIWLCILKILGSKIPNLWPTNSFLCHWENLEERLELDIQRYKPKHISDMQEPIYDITSMFSFLKEFHANLKKSNLDLTYLLCCQFHRNIDNCWGNSVWHFNLVLQQLKWGILLVSSNTPTMVVIEHLFVKPSIWDIHIYIYIYIYIYFNNFSL